MPLTLAQFVQEAQRRRLPQTGAWYVAVAWGGTEILAFITDALLGESAARDVRRYLAIFLIAGFPAAMYLAWTRDLGVMARRYLAAGVVAVLVAAVVIYTIPDKDAVPIGENSIAVLPFDVCEERKSDKPLADGLVAAIHGRLSEREAIDLKGWASVRSAIETSPSIPVIADLLKAKFLLTGLVCREGRDPTVSAEILDQRGTVVWKNDYRQITNKFDQVEVQLAELVDNGVAHWFGDVSTDAETDAVNQNALLQLQIGDGYRGMGDADRARKAYEAALEAQPGYPAALFRLATMSHNNWTVDNYGPAKEEAYELAQQGLTAARAAAQRDPRDFEANFFAGRILHFLGDWGNRQRHREVGPDKEIVAARLRQSDAHYQEAQKFLEAALATRPRDSVAIEQAAHNMDKLGVVMRRASMDLRERGLRSDQFNGGLASAHAMLLAEFGNVPEAMDVFDLFNSLPQGKGDRLWHRQLELVNGLNHIDLLFEYIIEMLQSDRSQLGNWSLPHVWRVPTRIAYLGLYEEAQELHQQVAEIELRLPPFWRQTLLKDGYLYVTGRGKVVAERKAAAAAGKSNEQILKALHFVAATDAEALWEVGKHKRAIEIQEVLARIDYYPSGWKDNHPRYAMTLAEWYLGIGRTSEASRVLDIVVTYLEDEVQGGVRHPTTLLRLAKAHGMQGNNEAALEHLATAVEFGAFDMSMCCKDYWSEAVRKYEEEKGQADWWESLEGSPEFELIRTRMRSRVDGQRDAIRAMLAQYDIGEIIARWTLTDPETAASQ